jgi:cobalamin biosynthesis protein CobT
MTRKDAEDLSFITRDQAIDVVIRLMEERDACVEALEAAVQWGGGMADAPRAARPEWFDMARSAIAQAKEGA